MSSKFEFKLEIKIIKITKFKDKILNFKMERLKKKNRRTKITINTILYLYMN